MPEDPPASKTPWRFERLADYEAPAMPTKETLRKKIGLLLRRFRPTKPGSERQLETAPPAVLDRAAPRPPRQPFFSALNTVVDEWLADSEPKSRVLLFVLPPCGEFELMREWAETRQAEIRPDPSFDSIIRGDASTLPNLEGDGLLIIPELERWFRRHHSGLALVRNLIGKLNSSRRRCVVGVNSWAWTYLCKAADAAVEMPPPLTLAPFDDQELCHWLSGLAASGNTENLTFRRHDTGEVIFTSQENCAASDPKANGNGRSNFLKRLAATSRGNPWLAWHIFRHCLRVAPREPEAEEKAGREQRESIESIWINPVAEMTLPELPKDVQESALLVLHALLIHGDLGIEALRQVLPPIHTAHVVHKLAAEGILLEREGIWRVAPVSYPAAREALSHHGFPVDNL